MVSLFGVHIIVHLRICVFGCYFTMHNVIDICFSFIKIKDRRNESCVQYSCECVCVWLSHKSRCKILIDEF